MFNRLIDHIAPQVHKLQFKFLNSKSTTTQLLELLHNIGGTQDKREPIDAISLDIALAFDRVSHKLLLKKLDRIVICGTLLS